MQDIKPWGSALRFTVSLETWAPLWPLKHICEIPPSTQLLPLTKLGGIDTLTRPAEEDTDPAHREKNLCGPIPGRLSKEPPDLPNIIVPAPIWVQFAKLFWRGNNCFGAKLPTWQWAESLPMLGPAPKGVGAPRPLSMLHPAPLPL